jgi:hypothetical protein
MSVDWFLVTLVTATILRGLGAGIIIGLGLMLLPARRRLGNIPYAQFTRTLYKGGGVRAYAAITILGALLTVSCVPWSFVYRAPALANWMIVASLAATIVGFVGTGVSFPTMLTLWRTCDDDEAVVIKLLDRWDRWHVFGAVWHGIAFFALAIALASVE